MRSLSARLLTAAWFGALALLISMGAGGVWSALIVANLKISAKFPWSAAAMAVVLWAMWEYLNGRWWPRSTAEARRRYLRARPVPSQVFALALMASVLAIVALAGYWIVMFQLVKMPANALPNPSQFPVATMALMTVMGSPVSPLSEEAAFRGYLQVNLERDFHASSALAISSLLFALAHAPLHGLLWPKLFVYFLAGVMFGATAYLTNSILPGIAVHILGDLTFFTMVWPYDSARRLIGEGGADAWFWIHAAQAIVFTALAILVFARLAAVSERMCAAGDQAARGPLLCG